MSTSKLDAVYRSILITKFFTKGWGKPENLRRLFEFRKVVSNRNECFNLVERDYPVTITKEQNLTDCKLLEGYFTSPLERYLPGIVPKIAQKAHFQALLPVHWPEKGCKPVCLHLAGTGDHFFWRRRNLMVKPLLKEAAIGGIILENPFYGLRKPTDQIRSSLHNVSDIFVMGGCLILESLVLFHWCERNGLGPLGVTGLSMGGHMASLAATNWPKPLVLVPCLSWSTASAVFLQGVMAHSINWDLLEDQYLSDGVYREKLSKMVTIVDEAFLAGKKFAQTYSQNMDKEDKDGQCTVTTKQDSKTDKKLDITYKESNVKSVVEQNIIDTLHSKTCPNAKMEPREVEDLNLVLKKLLDENRISELLYEKLTSNEKFELQLQDIEEINKLNEDKIKEVLMRFKVADANITTGTTSTKEEPNENAKFNASVQNTNLKSTTHIAKVTEPTTIESKTSIKKVVKAIKRETTEIPSSEKAVVLKVTKPEAALIAAEKVKLKEKPKLEKKSWNISDFTSDLWTNLSFMRSKTVKKIDISKMHWRDREALQFMRGIMDECTHLSNFSVPYDTSLIIAVCAKLDAYVPREDVGTLEEIWPGAEVRYVDAGHVSAYILHQSLFRACIKEAFERSKKNWKDGKHIN